MKNEISNITKVARFGLMALALFVVGLGAWAYFAPLESAAIAPGKVAVSGQRRTVQHLEGGIIRKILVKDGEIVSKDQVLIQLDNIPSQAGYEISHHHLFQLMAQAARLSAQIHQHAEITFPAALTKTSHQKNIAQIIGNQRAIFNAENKSLLGREMILKQRTQQLKEQIIGTKTELAAAQQQLKLINQELVAIQPLADKRYISRSKVLAYQREKAKLEGNVGQKSALIATLQQRVGETKMQLISMQDEQQKIWINALRDAQQSLVQQYQREKANKDVFMRTTIRAPQAGVVVGLKVHTVGGVIKPGQTLMEIVPAHERLIIEARINPLDIDIVHKGLTAKVILSALQRRTTPMLTGTVNHISADAFTDSRSGKSYYRAEITINEKQLKKVNIASLYPGMPAEVMIVTNKLTPWEYFTAPIHRSFSRAFREQ